MKNTNKTTPKSLYGDLHDYKTGEYIRGASECEMLASLSAAESDGGSCAFDCEAEGERVCYVQGEASAVRKPVQS